MSSMMRRKKREASPEEHTTRPTNNKRRSTSGGRPAFDDDDEGVLSPASTPSAGSSAFPTPEEGRAGLVVQSSSYNMSMMNTEPWDMDVIDASLKEMDANAATPTTAAVHGHGSDVVCLSSEEEEEEDSTTRKTRSRNQSGISSAGRVVRHATKRSSDPTSPRRTSFRSNGRQNSGPRTSGGRSRKRPSASISEDNTQEFDETTILRDSTTATDTEETDSDTEPEIDEDFIVPPPPKSKKTNAGGKRKVDEPARKTARFQRLESEAGSQGGRGRQVEGSVSGVVKSLKMFNFMCHDGFYQEWNPNLNFVTGENGSGKSALLSALLIGLGAKATLTNRTKSMKGLIQNGKDSARTEVTLMNKGALPMDKYGSEIVIERTITKAGSSTYKIKDGRHSRQLRKNELDFILMSLNIQLDNPVAILNQEVAKNFLRTKEPKDKYTLFYKGTLLETLFKLLEDSKSDIALSKANLDAHKTFLMTLKKDVRKLRSRLRQIEKLGELQGRAKHIRGEYYWAGVRDEEKRKQELKKKMNQIERALEKLEEGCSDTAEAKRKAEEELSVDRSGELQAQLREVIKKMDETKKELAIAKRSSQQDEAKIKTNKDTRRKNQRDFAELKTALKAMKSNSEEDKARALKKYGERKDQLLADKQRLLAEINSMKNDIEQFEHGQDSATKDGDNVQDDVRRKERELEGKKRQLTSLESSGGRGNRGTVFGSKMEALVALVEQNIHKFKKPPRGPIGSYVSVKVPKYAGLIEYVLQSASMLTSFVVNDGEDMNLLKKFINQAYDGASRNSFNGRGNDKPVIKVMKFKDTMHDCGGSIARVETGRNMLELLEIEKNDCVVINALIDFVKAERTIIFDNSDAAAYVMKDSSRCPRSTTSAYTLEDGYQFYPTPNYACRPTGYREMRPATKLQTSKKGQIINLKQEIQQLQQIINSLKPELAEKKKHESDLARQVSSLKSKRETKRREMQEIDRELKENEKSKYKEPDIASYEEELQEVEEALAKLDEQDATAKANVEIVKTKIEELEAMKETLGSEIDDLKKSIEDSRDGRQNGQRKIQELTQRLTVLRSKVQKFKDLHQEPVLKDIRKCEEDYELKKTKAESVCEKIDTNRTAAAVKAELDELKVRLQEMEKYIGDKQKLMKEFDNKNTNLEDKLKEFQPLYKHFIMLSDLVDSQLEFLFLKQMSITNGLTATFEKLVEERGYKGSMQIDHKKKDLHFYICPDMAATKRTVEASRIDKASQSASQGKKNTNKALVEYAMGLSGGERSYSTICFILSLWQVMECPFYMLDEFDVFMDQFNRKTSQQALMAHARSFKDRQFFLFSPLDLVEIPSKEEATVLRLRPARTDDIDNNDADSVSSGDNEMENVDPSPPFRNRTTTSKTQKSSGNAVGRARPHTRN